IKRFKFNTDLFQKLSEIGLFKKAENVDLFEGQIYETPTKTANQQKTTQYLTSKLSDTFKANIIVTGNISINFDNLNNWKPDISILRFQADFYKQSHPKAADILLIIEVADSTVEYDRTIKFPKYAAAKIPEAWLINLEAERIEVHSIPKENTYGMVKIYQRGEEVLSETMPELKLNTDDILG
nr:Uma2 family endonuclease [Pyrinomonadaceae bacterium]